MLLERCFVVDFYEFYALATELDTVLVCSIVLPSCAQPIYITHAHNIIMLYS